MFIFWGYEYLIVSVPFVENTIFSALNCLCIFVKNMYVYGSIFGLSILLHLSIYLFKGHDIFWNLLILKVVCWVSFFSLTRFPYSSTGQLSLILSFSEIYPKWILTQFKMGQKSLSTFCQFCFLVFISIWFVLIWEVGCRFDENILNNCILLHTNV